MQNWANNEQWEPQEIISPRSLDDLQDCVRRAVAEKKRIKVIGAGHSFSDCAATDSIQIALNNLCKVLSIDVQTRVIEVEAGILLEDLYKYFHEQGLALPTIPNTDSITLGGAIANATHGTNISHGTYSSLVKAIRLVTGEGELLHLTRDTQNLIERERFEAALVSFGALGIFYSITLQCESTYDIAVEKQACSVIDVRGKIEALARRHMSIQFMLFPLQNLAFIKTQRKIPRGSQPYRSISSVSGLAFELVLWMLKPRASKLLARLFQMVFNTKIFLSALRRGYRTRAVTNWSDGELSHHKSRFFNMEYAVPLERIEEALDKLFATTRHFHARGSYTRSLPFILRPVGADRLGYLSPTKDRDTCYVDILFQAADETEVDFFRAIEKDLLSVDGRVSWSRKFFAEGDEVLEPYSEAKLFFRTMRNLDPYGLFVNDFVSRIFRSHFQADE